MQNVVVLGSTGSIGVNTLDVIARHPERYRVLALSAATRVDKLIVQCVQYRPQFAVMTDETAGRTLQALCAEQGLPTKVLWGAAALDEVAAHPDADIVMVAIVGAAGLSPCLAAARAGKRLLLANKEALVVGGHFFMQAVEAGAATLLPIDSEHSAIFQSLPDDRSMWEQHIDKIILTASGGPFRTRDPATFASITPQQACAHPNWVMGQKISVDSATMMNKALEVIEARFLFGLAPDKIEVVIHPQSVIHSMVQYHDHSIVAQLGTPDMRVPIAYGLSWPERVVSGADALDFSRLSALTFESLHSNGHAQRFPGLALAWQALQAPEGTTAVLNAANEVAVAAFLRGAIRFDHIATINAETLSAYSPSRPASLQDLLALDAEARRCADVVVAKLGK
jgi:1-deoxy-D-xylulose-5-phosphate reductoisomerase